VHPTPALQLRTPTDTPSRPRARASLHGQWPEEGMPTTTTHTSSAGMVKNPTLGGNSQARAPHPPNMSSRPTQAGAVMARRGGVHPHVQWERCCTAAGAPRSETHPWRVTSTHAGSVPCSGQRWTTGCDAVVTMHSVQAPCVTLCALNASPRHSQDSSPHTQPRNPHSNSTHAYLHNEALYTLMHMRPSAATPAACILS
jgi:hypothetical protein